MKTIQDLFELIADAVIEDKTRQTYSSKWFIDFSGHVNLLSVRYYSTGWSTDKKPTHQCEVYLSVEGVQEAYWFIKNRLNK